MEIKKNLPEALKKEILAATKMKKAAMKLKKESGMMMKKAAVKMKKASAMKMKMKKEVMYDIKSKFKNSPLPCWKGYERVPGTAQGAKGSCRKSSPSKKYVSDAQRKAVWASKADGGKGNPNKMLSPLAKKQKGGGTRKTCLPASKIASMSKG